MLQQFALERTQLPAWEQRQELRAAEAVTERELIALYGKAERSEDLGGREREKLEAYCREQRQLLRQLVDLQTNERQMFEVDNDKDQIMSVRKVALASLAMYARDQWFGSSYATATRKKAPACSMLL